MRRLSTRCASHRGRPGTRPGMGAGRARYASGTCSARLLRGCRRVLWGVVRTNDIPHTATRPNRGQIGPNSGQTRPKKTASAVYSYMCVYFQQQQKKCVFSVPGLHSECPAAVVLMQYCEAQGLTSLLARINPLVRDQYDSMVRFHASRATSPQKCSRHNGGLSSSACCWPRASWKRVSAAGACTA